MITRVQMCFVSEIGLLPEQLGLHQFHGFISKHGHLLEKQY